ncbi:hypothetical protein [Planktotalea sp.]|uniref:hypothetical protein n=1 Tax=Planktotalea sp. TaxID=2029877 RepID=UPI0025EF9BE9|nr:hypothetical protein [Planktotalea sp.]
MVPEFLNRRLIETCSLGRLVARILVGSVGNTSNLSVEKVQHFVQLTLEVIHNGAGYRLIKLIP